MWAETQARVLVSWLLKEVVLGPGRGSSCNWSQASGGFLAGNWMGFVPLGCGVGGRDLRGTNSCSLPGVSCPFSPQEWLQGAGVICQTPGRQGYVLLLSLLLLHCTCCSAADQVCGRDNSIRSEGTELILRAVSLNSFPSKRHTSF